MKVKFKNGDVKDFDKIDSSEIEFNDTMITLNDEEGNMIAAINSLEVLYIEE